MFFANSARAPASWEAAPYLKLRTLAVVALVAAFAQGCTRAPPAPFARPDPSDPRAPVPAVSYRSATSGYLSQRPVAPLPWREQNQRVAPAPKP